MTPMPLLPAQPNAAHSAYRGSDDAALSGNEPDAGATFADMLAAGVQPPQNGDAAAAQQPSHGGGAVADAQQNATGGLTAERRQASHSAGRQAKHRHAANKAAPDGSPAAIPTPALVQQAAHGAAAAATGSVAEVVTNRSGKPTDPANRAVRAAALGETSSAQSALLGAPASGPAAPVTGSGAASIHTATQSAPPSPAPSAAQPTPSGGDDFGKVLSEFGTSTTPSVSSVSSASRQLGTTPAGDPARTAAKRPSRAANEPSAGVTRTLDHGALAGTRFDAGTTDIDHRLQASGQPAAHQRSTEHSPVIATVPAPSAASVLSSSGHLAAGASAPLQHSATVTGGQPQPAATPQAVHRQVSDALLGVRARGDGTHRMTLELHPADLGQVTVEVRIHAGAVSINLGSANDEARRSLSQALPQLRAELADAGLGGASVSVGADSSGGSAAHQNGTSGHPAAGTTSGSPAQQGSNDVTDVTTAPVRSYPARTGVDRWL